MQKPMPLYMKKGVSERFPNELIFENGKEKWSGVPHQFIRYYRKVGMTHTQMAFWLATQIYNYTEDAVDSEDFIWFNSKARTSQLRKECEKAGFLIYRTSKKKNVVTGQFTNHKTFYDWLPLYMKIIEVINNVDNFVDKSAPGKGELNLVKGDVSNNENNTVNNVSPGKGELNVVKSWLNANKNNGINTHSPGKGELNVDTEPNQNKNNNKETSIILSRSIRVIIEENPGDYGKVRYESVIEKLRALDCSSGNDLKIINNLMAGNISGWKGWLLYTYLRHLWLRWDGGRQKDTFSVPGLLMKDFKHWGEVLLFEAAFQNAITGTSKSVSVTLLDFCKNWRNYVPNTNGELGEGRQITSGK